MLEDAATAGLNLVEDVGYVDVSVGELLEVRVENLLADNIKVGFVYHHLEQLLVLFTSHLNYTFFGVGRGEGAACESTFFKTIKFKWKMNFDL